MKNKGCMAALCSLFLWGCGGGSGSGTALTGGTTGTTPNTSQRSAAATSTAQSTTNACATLPSFYWEIGDQSAKLVGGSVQSSGGTPAFTATTSMPIASASKWLYGAYVVQKRSGNLTAQDIKYLSFQSGFVSFSNCSSTQSVSGCINYLNNNTYTQASDGRFYYGGGHMQQHAGLEGLGGDYNAALATEIQSQLGSDVGLSYSQPQPAGGAVSTADDYALFLRKILSGNLLMKAALGTHAVCTNPITCSTADYAPIPTTESWHYSMGHWVEDDPTVGDGAFSSPGAFGFYPWIDASKTYYGVLARHDTSTVGGSNVSTSAYYLSVQCGRLIRQAWLTGVAR